MVKFIWKGRGGREEEIDITYRIYNYLFDEI